MHLRYLGTLLRNLVLLDDGGLDGVLDLLLVGDLVGDFLSQVHGLLDRWVEESSPSEISFVLLVDLRRLKIIPWNRKSRIRSCLKIVSQFRSHSLKTESIDPKITSVVAAYLYL